ncbi:N-acetylmuramoyl-L-alanine amidase [Sulfurimonas denitrificans DSM 1251]|uniref:N-acetylmuramoyl-L-alanine amidase n=1 Tax=Sulfurimonas denitrificans (strain ATCC 33889 / DSM 1251) TaxID=326298 RepID=Q30SN0_SULDN|nr:N-acetylmuramoyl-L-alanine amidase [Sulfurimonas denitrificans]ABB44001.1 N-acetylmuramoyl-L-alanine amidase [Sulfurimonas denitrificans DSM 1251]MDD3443131.1 N-acetylmuramoyl-L-alanine amidase [Sulfurimonas denitrificans]
MIKPFLLLLSFFIASGLFANSEILKRAQKQMQSGSTSEIFRAYNDYKSLYLHSMVEDDYELKTECLDGIVKSGNRLSIDVSKYEAELKSLSKTNYNKPEPKANKKTKHIEEIHVETLAKLKSTSWRGETLLIDFDKSISGEQINYFTLHDNRKSKYRYVFDIKTTMLTSSHNINKNSVANIKIAQFNPTTLRLVIENNSPLKITYNVNNSALEIALNTEGVTVIAEKKVQEKNIYDKSIQSTKYNNKTIVIDPGHGGTDPGAIGHKGYREKIIVFNISKELENILRVRGYKVLMTRKDDTFVKLSKRTEFANDKKADIFVSIHANAVPAANAQNVHGIECYFLSPSRSERAKKAAAQENSADMSDMNMYGKDSYLNLLNHHNILASNKLAIDLQRGMLGLLNQKYSDVKDGGVREGPFWVLVGAQMPSVLVEVGFISHPKEAERLVSNDYIKLIARGLADGIERYFTNN